MKPGGGGTGAPVRLVKEWTAPFIFALQFIIHRFFHLTWTLGTVAAVVVQPKEGQTQAERTNYAAITKG
jgi:hypothetical protein